MKSLVYTVVIDTMQEEKVRRGRKRSYDNKQHHLPTRTEHIPNNPKWITKKCRLQIKIYYCRALTTRQHNKERRKEMQLYCIANNREIAEHSPTRQHNTTLIMISCVNKPSCPPSCCWMKREASNKKQTRKDKQRYYY